MIKNLVRFSICVCFFIIFSSGSAFAYTAGLGASMSTKLDFGINVLAQYETPFFPVGWYFGAKLPLKKDIDGKDYTGTISTVTAETVYHDSLQKEQFTYYLFNIGPSFRPISFIVINVGIGAALMDYYNVYYDSKHILSSDGYYHIQTHDATKINFNVSAAAVLKMITLSVEYDTAIQRVSFGAGIIFDIN